MATISAKQDEYIDDTFKGAIHIGESIEDSYFQNCTFTGCQFVQTQFLGCVFEDCTFERCDLSMAVVTNSNFVEVMFNDCKLVGINWAETGARFSPRYKHCNLSLSRFIGLKIPELVMDHCIAKEVDFSEASLRWSRFTGTDFDAAVFKESNVEDSDFSDAKNYRICPVQNRIKGCTFTFPDVIGLLDGFQIKLS